MFIIFSGSDMELFFSWFVCLSYGIVDLHGFHDSRVGIQGDNYKNQENLIIPHENYEN